MRISLVMLLTVLAPLAAIAQTQSQNAKSGQNPSAVERSPHSNKADLAVLLCPVEFNDSLSGNGVANKTESDVTPPVVKATAPAVMSDEGRQATRKRNSEFISELSLLIGANGVPREVCIRESIGYGLDADAANTAMKYRFDPALFNGRPVSFRTNVEVKFRNFQH